MFESFLPLPVPVACVCQQTITTKLAILEIAGMNDEANLACFLLNSGLVCGALNYRKNLLFQN